MSNLLIVESKNDKFFMEALIDNLNYDIAIEPPICINDYECLEGLSKSKLINALKALAADIQKRDIQKVGIVIDIDNFSVDERIQWVNECINQVFTNSANLSQTGKFIEISTATGEVIKLSCYFTNVDGKGELETVLKTIKSQDSTFADCLVSWRDCLNQEGKSITDKDFDKFWVSLYIRFDTCSNKEKKQAERKCSMKNFDYIMKEKVNIWNLEHPALEELKKILRIFTDE
ncbi:DUF3226 domain-containing protein [Coleofasciculus sp. E1-EBD-02]|uniref:DUF3226 domain-containing protein n=1 Tax=Coleofasciculus sp. E1-EBD-02 TaxID=3068481 RepID=UPI0032FA663B